MIKVMVMSFLSFIRSHIQGIPGDGRCLFRSVVHGACLRTGKPSPTQSLEKELADELRANVVNEFIKRQTDSEWYLDGDFDTYITHMRIGKYLCNLAAKKSYDTHEERNGAK
ncbi:OTU domain-containing protein [Heracleum sosnowskyi]|uniref:OTU domain-containing protein n=1 Tax=Heracleum sosnowskyi TaxID=360622 RepID=A0AAD8GYF6_9APIA|nr:OTU domain-containing protein [Heracleum sosnowskyi]